MNTMITIVSGLPRSGTSMMMRMLEAGGMELVVDNIRKADEDNPYGYFEFEKVKKIKKDSSWLDYTQGKAFKIVSMLLYNLPSDKNYKIIFMKRNMKEIIASQRIMLERHKRNRDDGNDEQMASLSEKHVHQIEIWLGKQNNIDTLYVNYNNVIERPRENAEAVNHFLESILDVDSMIKTVDKSLYRNRLNI